MAVIYMVYYSTPLVSTFQFKVEKLIFSILGFPSPLLRQLRSVVFTELPKQRPLMGEGGFKGGGGKTLIDDDVSVRIGPPWGKKIKLKFW